MNCTCRPEARCGGADLEEGEQGLFSAVLLLQPLLESAGVVHPVDVAHRLHGQVLLEVQEQVQGDHGAACEEVARHPVVIPVVFKVVPAL